MSDDVPETDSEADSEITNAERIGRLQGIRQHLEEFESKSYQYLDLPSVYDSDPVANTPYVIPKTFIPKEIGGGITIIDADSDSDEQLAQENLNQMLNNFLPGGYKQRWGDFDLWRGAWHHDSEVGHADISPMFEWADSYPLTDLLGDVSEVPYTDLPFDPQNVRVYVPLTIRVTKENKADPEYVWLPEKGIVWAGNPPMQTEPLSSDPTTNYRWFKHILGDLEGDERRLADGDIITGFTFDEECKFVRCYYASLLTLYPRGTTQPKTGIIRYRCEEDDSTAFVASKERSQLLSFNLDRSEIRSRIDTAITDNPKLKRDLQFAFLRSLVWKRLFFEEEALEHEFMVDPLIEHLIGVDYQRRVIEDEELGVFGLSGTGLAAAIDELLPEDSTRHLRLLGHESKGVSDVLTAVEEHPMVVAELLARCRNRELLTDFTERTLVHSAEHALSTWSNNLTGSGTSFELWYDVTFQDNDDDRARIAVYDPVQGGAGIAKEVYESIDTISESEIERGLARQGRCHSATADRATVDVLASHPDGTLYDVYERDRDEFVGMIERTLEELVDDREAYSMNDLTSHVEKRVRSLFETRELAAFYSYLAGEHARVEELVGRVPTTVDLALHLNRHVFTDPRIKSTYERFADDSGRRDIAELGERIEELTIQCVTACPDCLKTDGGLCIHGARQQGATLNRRLLTAVFDT